MADNDERIKVNTVETDTLNVREATRCAADPRPITVLPANPTITQLVEAVRELQIFAGNNGDALLEVEQES